MTIIVCTQEHIAPDECVECGFWLHHERRGGYPGPAGQYCSEDCAAGAQERIERDQRWNHVQIRDLMCDCPVCTAAGHPTAAEVAEYHAYQEETT
jgi:ferredoxin